MYFVDIQQTATNHNGDIPTVIYFPTKYNFAVTYY